MEENKIMKTYKFIGTEQDLIDNGFVVVSNNHPYEDGSFPMVYRGSRHDLVVFYGVDREGLLLNEDEFIFDSGNFSKAKGKLKRNVFYSYYENDVLSSHYSILDLIHKGLVVEIVDGKDVKSTQ